MTATTGFRFATRATLAVLVAAIAPACVDGEVASGDLAALEAPAPAPDQPVEWIPPGEEPGADPSSTVFGWVVRQRADGSFAPADYFQVKFCTSSNGTFCSTITTTDGNGYYSFDPGVAPGSYWGFTWKDSDHWGSSWQSAYASTVPIGPYGSRIDMLSRPRPSPRAAIYPTSGSTGIPRPVTLQWTGETDPERSTPYWPVRYDVYLATAGGAFTRVATAVTGTSYTLSNLAAGTLYRWYVDAQMNTQVGAPGDPWYHTPSPIFTFKTRYPLIGHLDP